MQRISQAKKIARFSLATNLLCFVSGAGAAIAFILPAETLEANVRTFFGI